MILMTVYFIINFYIIYRTNIYIDETNNIHIKQFKIIVLIIYILFALTPLLGYILPFSISQKVIQKTANYFIGILFYIFITMIIFDILLLILKKIILQLKNILSINIIYIILLLQIFIISTICLYGVSHSKKIYTKTYNININKENIFNNSLKVALISDIHLGYNTKPKTMERITKIVNSNKPDIILIAGDIFDNSYDSIDNVKQIQKTITNLKSKYGKYAVYGNHDVEEKIICGFSIKSNNKVSRDKRMDMFLKESGVRILEDESTLINNSFYIIGRKDASRSDDGKNRRESIEQLLSNINLDKPIILLEHQPIELEEISNTGVDLLLAGHTHGGQFFPISIGTHIKWENPYGYIKKNKMHSIVTSGVGVYGPSIRIGSNSEVCIINITFKRK